MNANDVIDSYVRDVVSRLPRRLRNDVGFELRALLEESLAERAREEGRPADDTMAYALVREFGQPYEVADRYRPQNFTIIKPSDTDAFLKWAFGGVAVQWAVSFPAVMMQPHLDLLQRLGRWWLGAGVLALWWPGLLVTIASIAAFSQHRWPAQPEWRAKMIDHDRINRPLVALGITAALAGALLMIFLPQVLAALNVPPIVGQVLAYDPDFIAHRAPWMLFAWSAQLVLLGVVLAEGRWRRTTRRIDIAIALATSALLVWFGTAGPMWHALATDKAAKGIISLIVVLVLIDAALKIWRETMQIRPPSLPAAQG